MKTNANNEIPRATGLLIIEARNSNPNGDPDRESDPRTRSHDGRGIISDVSFKRKLRELVLAKPGPVWSELKVLMSLNDDEFGIHVDQESRDKSKASQTAGQKKSLSGAHWDVRVFGSTSLEEGDNFIRTGVAQFGIGVSAAKVRIQRDTNTVKANVDVARMLTAEWRLLVSALWSTGYIRCPSSSILPPH